MGEIKSTYDIIMERLSKVRITEEDKERLRQKELRDKITTIFKKYSNNTISEDEVIQELKGLGDLEKSHIKELITEPLLSLIDIEGTYINGISLLLKIFPEKASKISELQKKLEERVPTFEDNLKKKMLEILAKKGIKGNAIIPNIMSMPEWKDHLNKETTLLKKEIQTILNQ